MEIEGEGGKNKTRAMETPQGEKYDGILASGKDQESTEKRTTRRKQRRQRRHDREWHRIHKTNRKIKEREPSGLKMGWGIPTCPGS